MHKLLPVILLCVLIVSRTTAQNALFSHPSGFYTSPFTLTMEVPSPEFDLWYTIDGSNPQHAPGAKNGGKKTSFTIDPAWSNGRAQTPCFLVRVSLSKAGSERSLPSTQTYIFTGAVINQRHPGGNWPLRRVNDQDIDLEMDPDVTGDYRYKNQMVGSLTDIPSFSIVTDMENLFDPASGIYVNAMQDGLDWERFASVELIDPSGNKGFRVNAGLRIRGGWSRHGNYPKHAFRLFFREEYGAAKLEYPLFGDEGVSEFDKIDLRCEQNYAYSNGYGNNTCVREVFSRDTQRDMGQPYTRSRYYHLYLNGMYWGLYQTQERSEARYASDYFGDNTEDYDVIKVDGMNYVMHATDGTLEPWENLYNLCDQGFKDNARYFALEGRNAHGYPLSGSEIRVNIDNLIDYMLVIFYTGNFDAPISSFRGNREPNNFYCIDNHDDRSKGFVFFAHDSEHSLMVDAYSPGKGLYEDRVNLPVSKPPLSAFTPQWLHIKLSENDEYRQRFADRVYLHFFNNGVFTPEKAQERFEKRAAEVEMAIIAESARWGDAKSATPYTKDEHWLPEIEDIYERFFPYRTDIVIDQLIEAGLFNTIPAPEFKRDQQKITTDYCTFEESIEIVVTSSASDGEVYITRDGHDPRNIGGGLYPQAQKVYNGFSMVQRRSTIIKARVKKGNSWSPLHTLHLLQNNEDLSELKITELNYHPTDSIIGSDTIPGESFEFVELKNIGGNSINLTGLWFKTAIDYAFPDRAILAPKSFCVLASKPKWFYKRYGKVASGNYRKNFSNAGEEVILVNSKGNELIRFTYSDTHPWYPATDGEGYTLSSVERYPIWGIPASYGYWKASSVINGSPFTDDPGIPDGIRLNRDDLSDISVYPNPTKGGVWIECRDKDTEAFAEIRNLAGQKIAGGPFTGTVFFDLKELGAQPGMLLFRTRYKGSIENRKILFRP
ncbi:MAG TPA: CotH kinase family protein [Prolixibacteraceae bacterium]|nr:CotH kinase family protein [Prolixibacteraceae bacterium]